MKFNTNTTKLLIIGLLALSTSFTACKKSNNDEPVIAAKAEVVLEGQITTKKVLDANQIYLLKGYVRVMSGGSLEIPAGTILKGDKTSKAALIIERGGSIKANGTATNPIVFTSNQAADNRNIGDWSGIIICGKSTVNTANGTAQYEGGALGADVAAYGGTVPDDNSGEFSYVRIEFAGIAIEQDREINGLTLCGVGSKTKIHHIQVSYGGDDSFEFFGGTVNATHLIAYRGVDDDFDFDQGYTGKIQYGISMKDPNIVDASGTSRGIELENKGSVTNNLYTRPVISNFTFIGPGTPSLNAHGAGIHFGQNSRMVLANSIIVGARGNAVEFNTDFPAAELKAGRSVFSDNLVFGNTANYGMIKVTSFTDLGALTAFATAAGNVSIASVDAAGITSTSLAMPNFLLKTGSPALGKAKWTGDLSVDFTQETFIGAMGTSDWTTGWASWTPKTNKY